MKALFVPLLLVILCAISCNKASDSDFDNTTPAQKLSDKDWKLLQTGFDANANGVADYTELHYSDSTTVIVHFHLNQNGTGTFSYYSPSDGSSGTADLTWSIDATNTYITTNIPSLSKTTVSKIISLTTMNFSVVADTSQRPYWFLYFTRENP